MDPETSAGLVRARTGGGGGASAGGKSNAGDSLDGGGAREVVTLAAEGMDCPSCARTARRRLLEFEGVHSVDPDIIAQRVTVAVDPGSAEPEELRRALDQLGYGDAAAPRAQENGDVADVRAPLLRRLPRHVALGGALWLLTISATLGSFRPAAVALLATATVVATGWRILPRAFAAGRRGTMDMHVLMSVAALGALVIGEYVEAGAVFFLFAVAAHLEQRALERARTEVRSLMDLAPVRATVLRHGHRVRVPVEEVRRGELLLVRPGERIPVDGTVAAGSSEVDASAITGEAIPEPAFPGDLVYGGSVNGSGALEVRCDRVAEDSALGRVLRSIEEARSQKSPTERFVDRFARIYTPLVMTGALLAAIGPPLLGSGSFSEWGYRALVFVVVACPCALVISTPVTTVSALTGAARRGILIKSGAHLEALARSRVAALDKTGTLTESRPAVREILPRGETTAEEILRHAAAAESRSEHPIAKAILEAAEEEGTPLPSAVRLEALPGRGARARVGERAVVLGSPRLFREEGLLTESLRNWISGIRRRDATIVIVGWSEPGSGTVEARGAIVLTDRLRPGVAGLVPALRGLGVRRTVCLSGDRRAAVESAARAAGFDEWRGSLLPEEKAAWIRELRRGHGPVLMVGDGVNDAPALVASDVGMAMAAGGTALALDTADIALMEDDLDRIPEAFRLGRKAERIIRTNIAFALAVKVAIAVLGTVGIAALWMAVAADLGSSLAVILNGLRARTA